MKIIKYVAFSLCLILSSCVAVGIVFSPQSETVISSYVTSTQIENDIVIGQDFSFLSNRTESDVTVTVASKDAESFTDTHGRQFTYGDVRTYRRKVPLLHKVYAGLFMPLFFL